MNMLRKWYTLSVASNWMEVKPAPETEKDVNLSRNSESVQSLVFDDEMDSQQRRDLFNLQREFSDVPGLQHAWRMMLAEHTIKKGAATPMRQSLYQVPHAYRDVAQQELKERLAEGIAEPITSEWAVPMALVREIN